MTMMTLMILIIITLLLLNVFDNAPVCRRVADESWERAVAWRVSEVRVSRSDSDMTMMMMTTTTIM